jgi:signal transduction histidine kinase
MLILSLLFLTDFTAYAAETGRPFMTVYTAKATGGHFQNWAFMQDDRGVMYIGNGYGVQDISRVFLNIINNGCYEAHRKKLEQHGRSSPTLMVRTRKLKDGVEVRIRDNCNGIPEAVREKLFTPFFTTKPAGWGTSLGLPIRYDIIVHGHRGVPYFESE